MRLIVDVQGMEKTGAAASEAIAVAAALIAAAHGRHEVILTACIDTSSKGAKLARQFRTLAPRDHILIDALSLAPTGMQGAALVYEYRLQSLRPDAVLTIDAGGVPLFTYAAHPLSGAPGLHAILPLSDPAIVDPTTTDDEQRQRLFALKSATRVFARSSEQAAHLGAALGIHASRIIALASKPTALDPAGLAAGLLAELEREQAKAPVPAPSVTAVKPRLAYVSPLPPERSGIADYSAELIPALARHYDITLINDTPQLHDPLLAANFARGDSDWLMAHGDSFDRILYHFGNSPFHARMPELLSRHPGIVVMHDFYLSHLCYHLEDQAHQRSLRDFGTGYFRRAIYHAHGYGQLRGLFTPAWSEQGHRRALDSLPCSLDFIEAATGVIVHSDFSRRLAAQWYGDDVGAAWRCVPFPRADRLAAATDLPALPIAAADFTVCSFGLINPFKLADRLIEAWIASGLAQQPDCKLVFVGECAGPHGGTLRQMVAEAGLAGKVIFTGFASPQTYQAYLHAAGAAVQLRAKSHGETSAAVFDCLMAGVPLVVNANGAATELPNEAVCKLEDAFTTAALADALNRLYQDAAYREALGRAGRTYAMRCHDPEQAAAVYRDVIEDIYFRAPQTLYRNFLSAVGHLAKLGKIDGAALVPIAAAAAPTAMPCGLRQIFLDVTIVAEEDLKTGIQRVVRAIMMALIDDPPPGCRIEPVYQHDGKYFYARSFMARLLHLPPQTFVDDIIEARRGDIFVGLDLLSGRLRYGRQFLDRMRNNGCAIVFVAYDILPILHPEWFPTGTAFYHGEWLTNAVAAADAILCISHAVADDVRAWIAQHEPQRAADVQVGAFHLGADIGNSLPSAGLTAGDQNVIAATAQRPSLLMVGTIEPRKGHAQALAACEALWQRGVNLNLIIAGKTGWEVAALVRRLERHGEAGKRLHWLPAASDEALSQLYKSATVLIAASEGEGFGLPLIEAAQHGLPILARDIPIFREVAGTHAAYFDGKEPAMLATAIERWLADHATGLAPKSRTMPQLTWRASAVQFTQALFAILGITAPSLPIKDDHNAT